MMSVRTTYTMFYRITGMIAASLYGNIGISAFHSCWLNHLVDCLFIEELIYINGTFF